MTSPIRAIGIAWYREEDYPRIKQVMDDPHVYSPRYQQWLEKAEQVVAQRIAQGDIVEKVYIDPGEFPAWCRARGLHIDADARMRFCNEVVARKYRNQS